MVETKAFLSKVLTEEYEVQEQGIILGKGCSIFFLWIHFSTG